MEEFKKEIIKKINEWIKKSNKLLQSRGNFANPEHISGPIERVLEVVRIVKILQETKRKINERR